MAYLSDTAIFEAERNEWRSAFWEGISFPAQVFKRPRGPFLFFEFGLFFKSSFFNCLKKFLISTNETTVSFVVIDPDPAKYFYREFKKYPIVSFSTQDSAEDYLRQLSKDPGDSSADAIASNSSKVLVYPPSLQWEIFGDRDFDWAVLNCMSKNIHDRFIEHCESHGVRPVEGIVPFINEVIPIQNDKGVKLQWTIDALIENYSNNKLKN